MSMTMDILVQDHKNLARLLDVLERQVQRFEAEGDTDLDIVKGILDYCLTYPDLCHHPKEDAVLRRLMARNPQAAEPIAGLEAEHRKLAEVTRRFAAAVHQLVQGGTTIDEWFGDSARRFLDGYRHHMELEDTSFFPVALRELTDEDWAEVDREVEEMIDPLFGGGPEERFKVLRNEILMWDEVSE
ncbi:MAG: hemerythrin domain-containing protein [Kiloniellales bacterium]|nr:hemerythrin domain-containing protein [Kiloniellales bacterium]